MAQPSLAQKPFRLELEQFSPRFCYITISAALFACWVGFYLFSPLGFNEPGRDTWHHAAVLRELMDAPFAPSNPHLPTDEPSRYFTPVAVLAALVGRAAGFSPYQLFGYMGAASCIGLVIGCWTFARRYYGSPWAPLILLLSLLFAWGAQVGHAGLHTYATMLTSAAYPATMVLVFGLFLWTLALRGLDPHRSQVPTAAMLGALTAIIILVHQLSASFVLVGAGSLVLFHDRADVRAKVVLLGAMVLGSLATLAWPYFQVLEVISSASDPRWKSAVGGMNDVSTAIMLMAPTLLGVLGFRKASGGLRWELLLPTALFGIAYIILTLQDGAVAHRVPAAIVLYGQLGIVWLVLGYASRPDVPRANKIALASAALLLIAAAGLKAGMTRIQDLRLHAAEQPLLATAGAIAAHVPKGSISFATEHIVFPLQSTGRRVVSIPRPEPAAPSLGERQIATDRLFNPATTREERQRLIERWSATHIVFVAADLKPEVVRELRAMGSSKTFPHGAEVISLSGTKQVTIQRGAYGG